MSFKTKRQESSNLHNFLVDLQNNPSSFLNPWDFTICVNCLLVQHLKGGRGQGGLKGGEGRVEIGGQGG